MKIRFLASESFYFQFESGKIIKVWKEFDHVTISDQYQIRSIANSEPNLKHFCDALTRYGFRWIMEK